MNIVTTKEALREAIAPHRGRRIGFVPTMGYLHEGHLSLFRQARAENDLVVASIFVNPTQFAPGEDLDTYPRDEAGDTAKAEAAGVDLLWMPPAGSVYAEDHATFVRVHGLEEGLCGISRPHFFRGVATVVLKLFHLVTPTHAYFGEKDYQQLTVIRRMVRDLDLPIEVVGMPLVREPDGLAMSSRNAYLSAEERVTARGLSAALRALHATYDAGERDGARLHAQLHAALEAIPGARIDYADLVDAESLASRNTSQLGDATTVAALAVWIGRTRLLDNVTLGRPLA